MFVKKLILLCFTFALLAPLAEAKTNHSHRVRSHKAKLKRSKANWGSHKVKNKHS
jgi:hypothetical protein